MPAQDQAQATTDELRPAAASAALATSAFVDTEVAACFCQSALGEVFACFCQAGVAAVFTSHCRRSQLQLKSTIVGHHPCRERH